MRPVNNFFYPPAEHTMEKPKKPSAAQRRVLENIAAGRDPGAHLRGRSMYGGFFGTWKSLLRNDWVDDDAKLTEAGRKVIAA